MRSPEDGRAERELPGWGNIDFSIREWASSGVQFFTAIDHVQLAMPAGREDDARKFYGDILKMTEIAKPPELAKRGGVWFSCGRVQIHLGVEADFRPAKKAHPALLTPAFEELRSRLESHGIGVIDDDALPGTRRFYIHDCFGNRIEVISGKPA